MNSPSVERRLRSYLQERASEPIPIGMEQRMIRRAPDSSRWAPQRSLLWQAAAAAAIVVLALGIGLSFLYARNNSSAAGHSPTFPTSPTPAPPPGGPAPAELRGQWLPADGSQRLILRPDSWVWGGTRGELVVLGNEIDFYNGYACGIRLPGGVGRYQWTISGNVLRFAPLAPDPCSKRSSDLLGTFTKIANSG